MPSIPMTCSPGADASADGGQLLPSRGRPLTSSQSSSVLKERCIAAIQPPRPQSRLSVSSQRRNSLLDPLASFWLPFGRFGGLGFGGLASLGASDATENRYLFVT